MAAMVATDNSSNGSSSVSSSVLTHDKGSRNKRKFRADPPLVDLNNLPSSPRAETPSFEFSAEKSQTTTSHEQHGLCDLCSLSQDQSVITKSDLRLSCGPVPFEVGSSRPKEEPEVEEFQDADWSDFTESQLEELVLSNLDTIYKSAIQRIAACGYGEEVASRAVLRSGLCYGCKDTLSNIVDNALVYLRNGQDIDCSRDHFFENLEQLEKYVVAEMVCVLREVRPFFSIGDAMWCLLICDMNVSHACAIEGDPLNSFSNDGAPGNSSVSAVPQLKMEASSCEANFPNPDQSNSLLPCAQSTPTATGIPNLPSPKNSFVLEGLPPEKVSPIHTFDNMEKSLGVNVEHNHIMLHSSSSEEKSGGGRKSHSITSKRESILRQKSHHLEKGCRAHGSKSALRQGKLSSLSSLILDKKQKPVSDSTCVDLKSACLKLSKAVGVEVSQSDGNHNLSINGGLSAPFSTNSKTIDNPSSSPSANTELSLSLPSTFSSASKPSSSNLEAHKHGFSGIPHDKALGQWVSDDKKDELILKLAPRVRELQNQLQGWTDWANQKVMQAARRLGKDKAELKTLRQEKEEMARLKKEKQTLEENTMKKLSEMENALCKASGQVDRANSAVQRLEVENSELRQQMEEAKLRAAETAASCQEVSKREKRTLMKFQSWDKQKSLFQEELVAERRKMAQLRQEVEQAEDYQNQLEAKRKQEEKAKEAFLKQAKSIRKEREQIEASAKSKEDMIRLKAENDLQKSKDDIRKLEAEISQLRLKTDSSKIAALRWGSDGSYASRVSDGKGAPAIKATYQTPTINATVDFQDSLGTKNLKRERECVMCLTEEMSVVFLPCAHQVVCTKCNELHEKQGMKDCPSCRTPIKRRICVRFARS